MTSIKITKKKNVEKPETDINVETLPEKEAQEIGEKTAEIIEKEIEKTKDMVLTYDPRRKGNKYYHIKKE